MQATSELKEKVKSSTTQTDTCCYHCGVPCYTDTITVDDKFFCCDGCRLVYELINENGLCDYYKLQAHPGLAQIKAVRSDKYAYLDNEEIAKQLYKFTNGDYTIITLYIPGVHCSSCMWLLEHLNRVDKGIAESRLNFTSKEVTIHFSRSKISIRKVVELLTTIGYEPYISLEEANKKKSKTFNKQRIYKLGIAGFCFGNVMMMSFPEYLSHAMGIEAQYAHLFRYLNLILALPVFFYCANEFFITAWKGFRQKVLNIDAPIALALLITFSRSIYEIATNTGSGYLDSMCGIVFFMLVGRVVQERTYRSMSFHRDYKSYFPIAVNVVTPSGIESRSLEDLKEKDVVELHNDEIIPADSIVVSGKALIDYSFVTGETEPVEVKQGALAYAGGRQAGGSLTVQVVKPVAGSYLTSLWNHYAFSKNKTEVNDAGSSMHVISKYFTWVLFSLALGTGIFWSIYDPAKLMPSVTAMLIVACPCALLLTVTFTNGNLLRIFSNNGLYLRDATVIEQLSKANTLVFDKTGTITHSGSNNFQCSGHTLSEADKDMLYAVTRISKHPNSRAIAAWLGNRGAGNVSAWRETAGKGIDAIVGGNRILVGSADFAGIKKEKTKNGLASVYVRINDNVTALHLQAMFRDSVPQIIPMLANRYKLALLSGDHDGQRALLSDLFGSSSQLLFEQKPLDKLEYIEGLQSSGSQVIMIGDGLNDAGALQQSNVGITLADDINNFTPSCDAILDAKKIALLSSVLRLARASRYVIATSFVVSVIYNIAGLSIAMQGRMNPMAAAILMPCSTLTIVLITSGLSSLVARSFGLSLKSA